MFASSEKSEGDKEYTKESNHNGAAIPLSSEGSGFIVLTLLNNAARVTQNMN